MKKLIIILCLVTFRIAQANEPIIKMDIKPNKINIGQIAELTWQVSNAKRVYISTLGRVNSSGSQKLYPDKTTIISIIAEGDNNITSKSIKIIVMGTRGDGLSPDENLFRYPHSYDTTGVNYTDLLDVIHNVLQDTMGFSIQNEHKLHYGPFIFLTNYSQKGYLVDSNERTIGARRIAYAVEVKLINRLKNKVRYTIKSVIQYRKKIVRTWRLETSDSLYNNESERLHSNVHSALLKLNSQ